MSDDPWIRFLLLVLHSGGCVVVGALIGWNRAIKAIAERMDRMADRYRSDRQHDRQAAASKEGVAVSAFHKATAKASDGP